MSVRVYRTGATKRKQPNSIMAEPSAGSSASSASSPRCSSSAPPPPLPPTPFRQSSITDHFAPRSPSTSPFDGDGGELEMDDPYDPEDLLLQAKRPKTNHEREMMVKSLEHYERIIGGRPRGYRSPAWDFSEQTMSLLEEFGFEWDSSLMGREFDPYHPRPVVTDWTEGNTFGEPSRILEIPVSWYLDDFPPMEYVARLNPGLGDHDVLFRRWRDIFDDLDRREAPGVYALTLHPQCSGRSFMIAMLEKLIRHMAGTNRVWFCRLSDVYDAWTDD